MLMCYNFIFDICFNLNTVTMKTVITSLDPLRNFLVHIQEIDAGIAAQEWRATLYLILYLIMWDLNIM
jgi:hypothetical protein